VDYWTERQQRWFAIGLTSVLLAGGALAAAAGTVELALAAALAAPIVAAAASGRTLAGTLRAGLGGVVALWVVLGSLMFDGAGPGFPIFVGLLACFVLRWEEDVQVIARIAGAVVGGTAVWALLPYAWEAHWLLAVSIPPVLAVGLADEVAELFANGRQITVAADVLSGVSKGRKLACGAWACFGLAILSHMAEIGSPSLFVLAAVVLGISGAVASFSEPEVEGEVRAATFVMSAIPPLIVFGAIALLFVLLAQSDESWW
jgi:hypothetical protein